MKRVERQPDRRMIGPANHLPGVAVVADVPAPRQRLEADANTARLRAHAEFVQIGSGALDAAERVGRHIAADHQKIAAEFAHQIEFALGSRERAAALRLRHAFEIPERLKRHDAQAKGRHKLGYISRCAIKGQKVVFENFDTGEAGRGDRFQLFSKATAERDCCY